MGWVKDSQTLMSVVISTIIAILMIYVLINIFEEPVRGQSTSPLYEGIPYDATLLQLDKRALDEAYHNQVVKLFGVWISGGVRDPVFFQNGLRNVRRAYNTAADQIARREKELLEHDRKK